MTNPTSYDEAPDLVSIRRADIDRIDHELVGLVRRRIEVSAEIQRIRVAAGQPRIAHGREIAVLSSYGAALGPLGSRLGQVVLDLCRGTALLR